MSLTKLQIQAALVALLLGASTYAHQRIEASQMPERWDYPEVFDQTLPTSDSWWKAFGDPVLDSLISAGMENNYNVLTAMHRIEVARQQLRATQSQYYPVLNLSGGWSKQRSSGMTGQQPGPAAVGSAFNLGIDMSWQIDIFGKISMQAKEKKASFKASRVQYAAMMVTISAEIASSYMQLRTLQSEMDVLQKHIASQKRVVTITEARHEAGLASMLDVTQSHTTLLSTQASITALNTSITTAINNLATLIGVFPDELRQYLSTSAPQPDYHQIVAVGIPMELLRRRPDIAEAEYSLASYAAALGVAKKDFLPNLVLNGSIGTTSHDISNLFTNRSFTYTIAPTLSWTIFDGLGRSANVAAAKEQIEAGIDTYNNTVLTAIQEVDNAMTSYYNDLKYIDIITDVVEQARKSLELSVDLYKQGLSAFINVSNSQITLLQYSNELVLAKGQALTDLINLYKALGGGWQETHQ